MSTRAKRRGTSVESKVRDYLREALGQPGIDRQPLRGSRDQGDLSGVTLAGYSAAVEVKARRDLTASLLAEYRRQTLVERENAGADVAVLVTWRYRHGAAEAVAHMTLRDLAMVAWDYDVGECEDGRWASMTLAELCGLAVAVANRSDEKDEA